ncbi:TadE/TadG family type IV pilus assembly protein [Pseudomonas wadenswilerensis]
MNLLVALRRLRRADDGVTAVETAFILPVLLFGLMMLFELAHMALVIGAGNLALEHAVQRMREVPDYYNLSANDLQQRLTERMQQRSFGLFETSELKVDVLPFDNLRQYGGSRSGASGSASQTGSDAATGVATPLDTVFSPPILSITVDLKQDYMTVFPALFGLGDGYQYQYRHLLGNLPSDPEKEDSE